MKLVIITGDSAKLIDAYINQYYGKPYPNWYYLEGWKLSSRRIADLLEKWIKEWNSNSSFEFTLVPTMSLYVLRELEIQLQNRPDIERKWINVTEEKVWGGESADEIGSLDCLIAELEQTDRYMDMYNKLG